MLLVLCAGETPVQCVLRVLSLVLLLSPVSVQVQAKCML